jgi:hypothetical protein
MKIVGNDIFGIYIYPNDHPPPHCHVRYKNGDDISVDIPLIIARYKAQISKPETLMIEENIEKLCSEWERLNPKKEKQK